MEKIDKIADFTRDLKNPRHLAVTIVERVFSSNSYADILLNSHFQSDPLSPRNRALVTEIVYGTLRWLVRLDWILEKTYHSDWVRVPATVKRILEVALYQILFLDRVPPYAAVNEAVEMTKLEKGLEWSGRVNAILRSIISNPKRHSMPSFQKDPARSISIQWSHPLWIVRKWINSIGLERTVSLCKANNEKPGISIRANRMKTNRKMLKETLEKNGFHCEPSSLAEEFLILEKGGELFNSDIFYSGNFVVQDVSAGLVAKLVDPKPGNKILDIAAAPGGKTTHLAELGNDRAMVFAVDINKSRILKIIENKSRLGLKSIFPVVADGRMLPFSSSFDRVLVDVPCSGFGVLRKRAELRWLRKQEQITQLIGLQSELINTASRFVRKDGILVYSTCTLLDEENEGIVESFIASHPEFYIDDASQFVPPSVVSKKGFLKTWPDLHKIDGSFAARLKIRE